ncbi:RdgB/HAM1 family non-canonical purine NTP pyrophosphatase [Paenibacillaceae bacterium]|nr:RdgB/HAM1 family non-canonical purine NTP pyrophosphatase [Paenibacillaceae bacterium]
MSSLNKVVVVATQNKGKVREFAQAFGKMGIAVHSMYDYTGLPEIVEDGMTFAENARIKARIVGEALGVVALADDSGLAVAALDGAPGVWSARYAGENAADADNNAKLLSELDSMGALVHDAEGALPQDAALLSKASFECALALYDPQTGSFQESHGSVDGYITNKPRGEGGFGYDPLFWLPSFNKTMAELTTDEKQAISHRGEALRRLLETVKFEEN